LHHRRQTIGGVPVTVDRVLRAFVGQLLGEGRSHDDVAKLLGTDRTQITKYVQPREKGEEPKERREITMDHVRTLATSYPGGARALFARLDSIARTMPEDRETEDEQRTTGARRGRPPSSTRQPRDAEQLDAEVARLEERQAAEAARAKANRAGKKR
jgi:hypothetical protein